MNQNVKEKFDTYPLPAQKRMLEIRDAIFAVAKRENLGEITETLKWGEPSYTSNVGSPIRINWNTKSSETVSVYFHCQTILIATFRELYSDVFEFIGNREMRIPVTKPYAAKQLDACISMALRYHQIKKLPLLGA